MPDRIKEANTSMCGRADLCVTLCKIQKERTSRRLRMCSTEDKIATVPQEAAVITNTRHEETGETDMNQGRLQYEMFLCSASDL